MMRRSLTTSTWVLGGAVAFALGGNAAVRADVCALLAPFAAVATPFNGIAGVEFYEPADGAGRLLVSVNPTGEAAHTLELIDAAGTHTPFSALSGAAGDRQLAAVRAGACMGGFEPGDVFLSNDQPGQIAKIGAGGTSVANPWVTLPGENATVRHAYQDRSCAFNGDLIVVAGAADVWRVTAEGSATLVATVNVQGGAVITVPNDAATYGPIAGRILVGDEGRVVAIDATGDVVSVGAGNSTYQTPAAIHAAGVQVIPRARPEIAGDADFVGVDAANGRLLTAPASAFACACGNILLVQETPDADASGLAILGWNGSGFDLTPVAKSGEISAVRWGGVTFRGGTDNRKSSGLLGDFVWRDLDGDGLQDEDEPGIEGITLTLIRADVPSFRESVKTDATGHYQFTGLSAGTYFVIVTLPDGETLTRTLVGTTQAVDSNSNGVQVTLGTDGDNDLSVDFGLKARQ